MSTLDEPRATMSYKPIRTGGVCFVIAAICVLAMPMVARAAATWRVFGAREFVANDIQKFPKWVGMLRRNSDEENHGDVPCSVQSLRGPCLIADWKDFIAHEQGRPRSAQLDDVNREMNAHLYRLNSYYWETPREFLIQDGDCKDYAIAKYFTLRKLGWSDDDLRVVVLRDMNIQQDHAILVAYSDGKTYSLDNQIPTVLPTEAIHHYWPYYAINESHWWMMYP